MDVEALVEISATPARQDPRIVRSEAAIQQALLQQLQAGRDLQSLSVSEIAQQAGLTRKTFYARFGSLYHVVGRIVGELLDVIAARIDDEMLQIPLRDNSLAVLIFRACAEQQTVLGPLVRQCPTGVFVERVSYVADRLLDRVVAVNQTRALDNAHRAYFVASVSSMLHSVLLVWVERDFSEAPEQVAEFMDTLLSGGMQKVVLGQGR